MALDVELSEIRDFLARHEPFAGLPDEVLDALPRRLSVEYFRRGSRIIARGSDNHHLYLLRSGAADVHDAQDALVERGEEGTSFGSITLTQGNPSTFSVTAIEDSLALLVPEDVFHRLCREHETFDAFFDAQRARRMRSALAELETSASGTAVLRTRVRDLVTRDPVAVTTAATIREAAVTMADEGVSSLLVMEGDRLAGIVTDRDLRTRVLAADVDPARPVTEVMSADPATGSVDALAVEALLTMTGRGIHHLPLVDDGGRPVGVMTTTDLLRVEQSNPVFLAGDVAKQSDVAGVARVAQRLPRVVQLLVEQDATASDIGRAVTAVGDAVEQRLIALAEAELGPPPVPYAWVALGSRARLEQALAADQDHALVLDDSVADADLPWFEALAERVASGLEECGWRRCPGEVMATNPRWRMPLSAWQRAFSSWLDSASPEAVLSSAIFFDLRAVHGEHALAARLHQHVVREAPHATRFLAHLARQAGSHEPPLGFFRGLVLEKAGEHKDALDIKKGGVAAVVEIARVHALAVGSPAVSTRARIDAAQAGGALSGELAADLRDAFEYLGYVRLRHQAAQVRAGLAPDNFVAPAQLSSFEKRPLREAFGIVRFAQQALGRRHVTAFVS